MGTTTDDMEFSEIQGNVIRGYGAHVAKYILYSIDGPEKGRNWLQRILAEHSITTSEFWERSLMGKGNIRLTTNLAFTWSGLKALGVREGSLQSFPEEFREGMCRRAVAILGDEAQDEETGHRTHKGGTARLPRWVSGWFYPPDSVHALLILTAKALEEKSQSPELSHRQAQEQAGIALDEHYHVVRHLADTVGGIRELRVEQGLKLFGGREHFGYKDGISQPCIRGAEPLFQDRKAKGLDVPLKGQGTPVPGGGWNPLNPGEFVLGYQDETGFLPPAPQPDDLGKNGTYLVFRKLSQDVEAFQDFLEKASETVFGYADIEAMAAKIMGRWRNGCPLIGHPDKSDESVGHNPEINNDFRYGEDPTGRECPLGSHIRRTNPRDSLSVGDNRRHRILRRGLPYTEGRQKGLLFLAINASISRQFEFLQRNWINNGDFLGLDRNEQDPVMGSRPGGKFTVTGAPFPFTYRLDRFVEPQGGEYFFYPSLTALKGLASGKYQDSRPEEKPLSFIQAYADLERDTPDTDALARSRHALLLEWMAKRPKHLFEELRQDDRIWEIPGYHDSLKGPQPSKFIVSKDRDVREVLKTPEVFSVRLYAKKMAAGGGFILGMPNEDQDAKQYERELTILRSVVRREDLDRIRKLAGELADERLAQMRRLRAHKLDVVSDFSRLVPALVIERYFGVEAVNPSILMKVLRVIFADTFLNVSGDNKILERGAEKARKFLEECLRTKIDRHLEGQLRQKSQEADTVLARLIPRRGEFPDGSQGIVRSMIGMVVGVLETTSKSITYAMQQLLLRPASLQEAQEAARANHDEVLARYLFEAMRFRPQSPALFRFCEKGYTLGKGMGRETVIPQGSVVIVGTQSAMFDPEAVPDPESFRIDRPYETYLFYGFDRHRCLGEHINNVVIPEVAKRILRLKGLRRAQRPDGTLEPLIQQNGLFPNRFLLEFDPD